MSYFKYKDRLTRYMSKIDLYDSGIN